MIFEKPPNIIFPIILLAGFVISWIYPASGWFAIALPIIGLIMAGSAVVTGADWLRYRILFYQTMQSETDVDPELELARLIRGMDEARFRVYALALLQKYGDDETTGALIDRYIDQRTRPTDSDERIYRLEVLDYIKRNSGELPAIRDTSEGSKRRQVYAAIIDRLVREGAADPAVGNQNAKVQDFGRAYSLLGGER